MPRMLTSPILVLPRLRLRNSSITVGIGADPYQRKTVTFDAEMDRAAGAQLVKVKEVGTDNTPFRVEYDPDHPAADKSGFVKLPNVNMLIEMADMREANRSYEADLQIVKQSRQMISMTIDLLRNS